MVEIVAVTLLLAALAATLHCAYAVRLSRPWAQRIVAVTRFVSGKTTDDIVLVWALLCDVAVVVLVVLLWKQGVSV